METFFRSNPGMSSRIAHHIDFPDYTDDELLAIGELILKDWNYLLAPRAKKVLHSYIEHRRAQPHFANARSIRNALDRARLRQARRLLEAGGSVDKAALQTIEAEDILQSRVLGGVRAVPTHKERA
jgi:hypothetical protein